MYDDILGPIMNEKKSISSSKKELEKIVDEQWKELEAWKDEEENSNSTGNSSVDDINGFPENAGNSSVDDINGFPENDDEENDESCDECDDDECDQCATGC